MSIFDTIGHLAKTYRHHREIARTERMIGSLPTEIRKDIGWPDSWDAHRDGNGASRAWYRH